MTTFTVKNTLDSIFCRIIAAYRLFSWQSGHTTGLVDWVFFPFPFFLVIALTSKIFVTGWSLWALQGHTIEVPGLHFSYQSAQGRVLPNQRLGFAGWTQGFKSGSGANAPARPSEMELCKCSPAPWKKCCFQNCVWKDGGFLEPLEAVRDESVTRNRDYGHPEGLRKVFLGTALGFASIPYFPYKELGFFLCG